ncbi:MAG: response regulator [Candidatus Nitrosocosmicus sp.]|jgi:DNA-binding response OmpR family regulator|uniref:response regulator n=1 Tax=Candidatus Nitrosocosmicus agrestis TaxID=2563600 RepID=UPI00122E156C|nr:response regulator [Candidatus Nitrosocosmicus sp. SS]KAA2280206.1 response regulator [Candidatus Nitrosocosmicus sp. SS]KAF0869537.1 response regulator [Candidatus Nitrosocosmicus sp. SS]MDR4491663.1 response regulator [Candidatus Nitrosocosmicus sp.]
MIGIDFKKKILIVDDEEDITFIFKIILEDSNYEVEIFNDPIEALSNYKKNYYDLILLDLKLPSISGTELYSRIKDIDSNAKICFLTSSEQISLFNNSKMVLPKSITIIQKPIENSVFVQKINDLLTE